MKYKTAIFDLDGTLLDTLEDLAAAVNASLQKNRMPLRTVEEVRQFVGNGIVALMERAVPDGKGNPSFDRAMQIFGSITANIATTILKRIRASRSFCTG